MARARIARRLAVAPAALGLVALAACGGGGDSGGGDSETLKLGYTATLTGDFASYGLEMREGVDLAVEELNAEGGIDGKKISIESIDDEGKPGNGPVVAQQLCDDTDVSAVLGYSFSSVALSAVPVYTQCGLPVVASAVTSPELSGASPNFFRTAFTDAYQGEAAGQYVADQGVGSVAVMYQQDDYGQGVAEAFTKSFEEAGGTVTSSQAYQLGTNNFGTLVDKAASDDPDAFFIGGFYTESAKIANQTRSSDIDLPLYASDGSLSPQLVELGGDSVEAMTLYAAFSPNGDAEKTKEFTAAFQEKYDKEPTSWAALAYDAVYALNDAAESGGGTSREQLTSGLAQVDELPGATGTITFDDEGNRVGELTFLKVEGGKFVPAPTS